MIPMSAKEATATMLTILEAGKAGAPEACEPAEAWANNILKTAENTKVSVVFLGCMAIAISILANAPEFPSSSLVN